MFYFIFFIFFNLYASSFPHSCCIQVLRHFYTGFSRTVQNSFLNWNDSVYICNLIFNVYTLNTLRCRRPETAKYSSGDFSFDNSSITWMQHRPQDQHGDLLEHGSSWNCNQGVKVVCKAMFTAEDRRVYPAPLFSWCPKQFVRTCPWRLQRQARVGHERCVWGDWQSHSKCG